MIEQAPRQVAVKVSPESDRLITIGAHYLHLGKKGLVEAAVAFYVDARREEMRAGTREPVSQLGGRPSAAWRRTDSNACPIRCPPDGRTTDPIGRSEDSAPQICPSSTHTPNSRSRYLFENGC